MSNIEYLYIEEIVRMQADFIKRVIRLLEARERAGGTITPSLSRERVQGGDFTPQAIRILEIDDCLKHYPEDMLRIASAFRRVDDLKAQAYLWGLLDGLDWESIRKRGRIKEEDRQKFQQWLIELFQPGEG